METASSTTSDLTSPTPSNATDSTTQPRNDTAGSGSSMPSSQTDSSSNSLPDKCGPVEPDEECARTGTEGLSGDSSGSTLTASVIATIVAVCLLVTVIVIGTAMACVAYRKRRLLKGFVRVPVDDFSLPNPFATRSSSRSSDGSNSPGNSSELENKVPTCVPSESEDESVEMYSKGASTNL